MTKHIRCTECDRLHWSCQDVRDHFGNWTIGAPGLFEAYCPLCWWTNYLGINYLSFSNLLGELGLRKCGNCGGTPPEGGEPLGNLPDILDPGRTKLAGRWTWFPNPPETCAFKVFNHSTGFWETAAPPPAPLAPGELPCRCNTCSARGF